MKTESRPLNAPVLIHRGNAAEGVPVRLVANTARRIYAREKIPVGRKTHVVFCSDDAIRKLNARFRGKNRATDVLSFTFDEADLLGEIYISLRRAAVQARRYHVSRDNEILRLFVHGMFHLLGFDHQILQDRRTMEAKESQYLPMP
jgi:probable rRNA maturation factor